MIGFTRMASATAVAFVLLSRVPGGGPEREVPPAAAPSVAHLSVGEPGRTMAVTFDDLPGVAQGDRSVAAHARITDGLLRHIAEHRVPAIGFVNEDKLVTDGRVDPRRVDLLRRWADAGLELGNHGYAHADFHANPLDAFIADMARGDSVTRLVLADAGRTPRFFRHPYLRTGRSLEDRRRFESALAERGYRVAPVTIGNSDYVFAAAYDLAPADSVRRRVADEYLRHTEAVTAYYEQQSRALFGREIAQVLLLHANHLNADHFGRVAEMLARRGYTFVPLDEALRDPAYASEDTFTGPGGMTWIQRWALTQGRPRSFFDGRPEVPEWVTALSGRPANARTTAPGR